MKSFTKHIKDIALIVASLLSFVFAFAQEASFEFFPQSFEVYESEIFETQIRIETGNVPVTVFDLHLSFNSDYLQVVEVEMLNEGIFNYHLPAEFDNNEGKIDMAAFKLVEETQASFAVANITFMALMPTETTQVVHILDEFPKSTIAFGGEVLLGNAENLDVSIVGSALSDESTEVENGDLSVWPNPANNTTTIGFELREEQRVRSEIYSIDGKLIDTLFEGEAQAGTSHRYEFDVKSLAAGNYSVQLLSDSYSITEKLTVIK